MLEEITLTITGISHQGDGLSQLPDGRAIFVPFTLPGEEVRIRITEQANRFARGEIVELIQPSPERQTPRCAHFGKCGGCQLQHMPYSMQLESKVAALQSLLVRTAGIENPPIHLPVPGANPWEYRNHVQFDLTPDGALGFHGHNDKDVLPIQECHIIAPTLLEIWRGLDLENIPELGRVSLRVGAEEEALVLLEGVDDLGPDFSVDFPISVVYLNPAGHRVLSGREYLITAVLDRYFQVSAPAFFQVNTAMAGELVKHILDNLPESLGLVLDVYCGGGLFSAFLAPRAREVIGIEADPFACLDYEINLDEFDHISLYESNAGDVLPYLHLTEKPDLVIVDPPRSGIPGHDLDEIIKMEPHRLVYVSNNPATLARDAKKLRAAGYNLEHITPFDLFPQTYHLETISFWSPGKDSL